jgi:diguanylate cyclase (GGDEF)-like protein
LHALWALNSESSLARDLILYNAIWIASLFAIISVPLTNDPVAIATLGLAITAWGIGSALMSYGEFHTIPDNTALLSQFLYFTFYPLVLIAIPRLCSKSSRLTSLELLDSAIFGLGFTSMLSALFLTRLFPNSLQSSADDFFAVLYPVADLALLVTTGIFLISRRIRAREISIVLGIAIFATADFYFLWLRIENRYSFGALVDDIWLLAIVVLASTPWLKLSSEKQSSGIHPALIALSIFISPTLLAISALRPGLLPIYVLVPSVANLALAFIRMSIMIRQARNLGDERILARTDELTGLPNRRRLMAELESYSTTEGAFLLLDLDRFKPVNDEYGHEAGNQVLRQVAQRFSRVLPTGSVLARLGGDEFGVLMNGNYAETLEVAHALRATLTYPFLLDGVEIRIGVSIGHVYNDGSGRLLERADAAMYEAKRSGDGVRAV